MSGLDPIGTCQGTPLSSGCADSNGLPHSSFYRRAGKRWFDVVAAILGLLILLPVFIVVAVLVKITSRGPVLFHQDRVGKDGKIFSLVKFRTMIQGSERRGLPITVAGDARITWLGTILRRYKVDELPQLWNVLKGDMSLVGPRPEIHHYVKNYTPYQQRILAIRPGITDPASIAYRHEERTLMKNSNPEEYYRATILPHKISVGLRYINDHNLRRDLSLLWKTIISICE